MDDPNISDLDRHKKLLERIRAVKAMKTALPFITPFLKRFVDTTKMAQALNDINIEEFEQKAMELASMPDRFNQLFADRGWITYEEINPDIVLSCITKGEAGDLDGAEQDLVDFFTPKFVSQQLLWMNAVKAFRPRMRLAKLAQADYEAERYHACIPVVLALMDGLVNDLYRDETGQPRGLFADKTVIDAWDSISAHRKGFGRIVGKLRQSKGKTTNEVINFPYRNGIMHGTYLNYDSKMVAAKTWALLFALRDWAIKAERGHLHPPPATPKPTWGDINQMGKDTWRKLQETAIASKLQKEWQPREITLGQTVPNTGEEDDFANGTPERTLARFLNAWKRPNYKTMAEEVHRHPKFEPINTMPKKIRAKFSNQTLQRWEFTEIVDDSRETTEIQVLLYYKEKDQDISSSIRFRLINFDENDNPVIRGKPRSRWYVFNWNFYGS